MKKVIVWLFVVIFLALNSLSVSAEPGFDDVFDADAKLNVSYNFNGENIVVTAYFSDIKVKDGIISIEYDIEYDHNTLELVNIEHYIPEKWNTLILEENVEDFSRQTSEGVYHWGYAVISLGEGAKNDKELGIVLEFKPLDTTVSDIRIGYSDLRGEILKDGKTNEFVHMTSNSAKITFDPLNKANSKLYYAHVDPKSNLRERFIEVDNLIENVSGPNAETNNIYMYLSLFGVGVCLVVFALAVFYIFAKSKRG